MKTCCTCKQSKPLDAFGNTKHNVDGKQRYCRSCQKEVNDKYYAQNKDRFLELNKKNRQKLAALVTAYKVERGCKYCDESRPWCLDFHHPNDDKEFSIGSKMSSASWKYIENEISKCDVVCRNCHADIHYKERLNGCVVQ